MARNLFVKGFGDAAGYTGQGIGISAKRNGFSQGILPFNSSKTYRPPALRDDHVVVDLLEFFGISRMDRNQDLGSDRPDGIFQVAFAGMAGAVSFMQGDPEVGQPIIEYAALILVFLALEEGLARAVDVVGLLGTDIDELHEFVEAGEHDVVALAVPDLAEGDHVVHISLVLRAIILRGEFAALS